VLTEEHPLAGTGIEAAALKPAECDVSRAADLPVDTVAVDYEGPEHVPDAETLEALTESLEVRLTTPVRADGYDPLGDDGRDAEAPASVGRVLVAGHPAYLDDEERKRAVAPRFGAAVERHPDAWVGSEGVERVALATGRPQFELLSRSTERDLRALRAAGHEGTVAVYAPTVLTDDDDAVLDAVGDYVARRGPVADALPDGAATDASAAGRAREVLHAAARDYALVGDPGTVGERVDDLKAAGADVVVAYPARGLSSFVA
jgi:alkanesulfonate monooxygenase SsuD/methylene tetrahydromethanopterin reductase-like flavin-dependent oxidoreductase (luciferase family)